MCHCFFKKTTIVDRLNQLSPDLEIYIIPDARSKASAHSSLDLKSYIHFTKKETLSTISILLLTTLASYGIFTIQPNATNAILLFVLAACVIGVTTLYPIYSILAAIYSVTIINFLFIEPRFTFEMSSSQYTLIFICMIAVSFTISYFCLLYTSCVRKKDIGRYCQEKICIFSYLKLYK